MKTIIESS